MSLRLSHFVSAALALVLLAPASSIAEHRAAERHAARLSGDLFVPAGRGWVTYVNALSGARLTFPADLFEPLPPEPGGDNQRFQSRDGQAQLEFIALPRAAGQTPRSLQHSLIGREGYREVTYAPRGRSWFVVSGYRNDEIFYEKYMFAGSRVQAFAMAYPERLRHVYDRAVEAIEKNFRPGR